MRSQRPWPARGHSSPQSRRSRRHRPRAGRRRPSADSASRRSRTDQLAGEARPPRLFAKSQRGYRRRTRRQHRGRAGEFPPRCGRPPRRTLRPLVPAVAAAWWTSDRRVDNRLPKSHRGRPGVRHPPRDECSSRSSISRARAWPWRRPPCRRAKRAKGATRLKKLASGQHDGAILSTCSAARPLGSLNACGPDR